jgi:chitin disaccharide deacetylase
MKQSLSDLSSAKTKSETTGLLLLNADDWGRDRETTDRILDCSLRGAISSASAMVFMQDSARAAELAIHNGMETGLHLNLVTPFDAADCGSTLKEQQERLARYLMRHRLTQVVFHPGLKKAFDYVVKAQVDEYRRLYGELTRIDGHHHMHLSANVLRQRLLPDGTVVRRNFSFQPGEKSVWNRLYREMVDRRLARRHRLVDYFFSLPPLDPTRLRRIFNLSQQFVVEVETHPVNREEYKFLMEGGLWSEIGPQKLGRFSAIETFQPVRVA